jgi:hypothetical protein
VGPEPAARELRHRHREGDTPDDGAPRREQDEGREVRREVHDLGLGRSAGDSVAEQGDERDDEERAGPGAEEPVVRADRERDGRRERPAIPPSRRRIYAREKRSTGRGGVVEAGWGPAADADEHGREGEEHDDDAAQGGRRGREHERGAGERAERAERERHAGAAGADEPAPREADERRERAERGLALVRRDREVRREPGGEERGDGE